ncbi:MAG: ATP-dependent 6-phosphofructokinase [Clostridiales bacterium]|nr:ATP-dependent 6-phosphofructokinase [Clostridiales bacterium]
MRKIGILCSGGDCPGMNACIKAVVGTCVSNDIEVIGINRGYQGLIENDVRPLTLLDVANIETIAGSIIKTSRSAEFMTEPGFNQAVANLKKNGIEGLIVIGGNGSFRGCRDLVNAGVKVIGIPGTIDNDLFYTERSLGFDTAVQQAVDTITDIKQTMYANDRAVVFKCMGRHCGDIALHAAVAVEADALAVNEVGYSISEVVRDVKNAMKHGITSPVVVISEGSPIDMEELVFEIQSQVHLTTRGIEIGYLQRGGAPTYYDRMLAVRWGVLAVDMLRQDLTNLAVGIKNDKIFSCPLIEVENVLQEFRVDMVNDLRTLHGLCKL